MKREERDRDAWIDGYIYATGCTDDEAEDAFEQFLDDVFDEDEQ